MFFCAKRFFCFCCYFIFFSSVQVYGSILNGKYYEESDISPDSVYSIFSIYFYTSFLDNLFIQPFPDSFIQPFPYGFYTLLRLIVSITAGIIIYHSYKGAGGINEISIIFALILILYNPIAPVHLSKEICLACLFRQNSQFPQKSLF